MPATTSKGEGKQKAQGGPDSKSIGSGGKAPGSGDAKSTVKELKAIAEKEIHHPEALNVLQKLQDVKGNANPTAPASVGGMGAVSSLMGQISSMLSSITGKKQPQANTEPDTAVDCSLANRPNLSPDDLVWCEMLDDHDTALANTSNTRSSPF